MKKATLLFIVLTLFPFIPGPARADLPAPDFSQATWGCGLNLSVGQTEKMRALQEGFLRETKDLRERLKEEQANLRGLSNRRNPDQDEMAATRAAIAGLESRIRREADRYRSESAKVLTPEHQAQLGRFPAGYARDFTMSGSELQTGRRAGTGYGSCPRL